jgi:hypothetical protein
MPERTAVEVNLSVHRLTTRGPAAAPVVAPTKDSARVAVTPAPAEKTAPSPPTTSTFYRDPLMEDDTSPLSSPATDEDLYVGPSYPVAKDDDDEDGTGQYTKPSAKPAKTDTAKATPNKGRQR